MSASLFIAVTVGTIAILGLNVLTWIMVIDEWQHDNRTNALIGAVLMTLLDMLVVALILNAWGL